jgi:hypothetical protein
MPVRVVNVRGLNAPAERAAVCYVGRVWAGWLGHPLGNPFRPNYQTFDTDTKEECAMERALALTACLDRYREYLASMPDLNARLAALWEECEHGTKPLGCWCVNATTGDGSPRVCHAQILAELLVERFESPEQKAGT